MPDETSLSTAPEDHPLSREASIVKSVCQVNVHLHKTAEALKAVTLWQRTVLENFQRATEAMRQVSEAIASEHGGKEQS